MPRSIIARYLCIPAMLALGTFAFALRSEPFGIEILLSAVLGGFLFYAAPFLAWALVVSLADLSAPVSHTGFIAPSVALVAITLLSFVAHDPSGLPMQWLLYWPLAVALQAVSVSVAALYVRRRSKIGA